MTYKEFCEQSTTEFILFVEINGDTLIRLSAFSLDSLMEQSHKLDKAIADGLWCQYEDTINASEKALGN